MREKLVDLLGSRLRFYGTFEKYGLKSSYKGLPKQTLLLVDVKRDGELITDHLWFNLTKGFNELGDLSPGDVIAFDARVGTYVKGYVGRDEDSRELDYRLTHPTKIRMLSQNPQRTAYLICDRCRYRNEDLQAETCRRCGMFFRELPAPRPEPVQITLQESLTRKS